MVRGAGLAARGLGCSEEYVTRLGCLATRKRNMTWEDPRHTLPHVQTKLGDVWPPPNWLSWPRLGRYDYVANPAPRFRFVIDSTWGYENESGGGVGGPTGDLFLTDRLDGEIIERRRVTLRTSERVRQKMIERAQTLNASEPSLNGR